MGPDLPITGKFNSSMIQSKVLMKIKWLINLYGISMAFIFTLKLLLTGPYKKKYAGYNVFPGNANGKAGPISWVPGSQKVIIPPGTSK